VEQSKENIFVEIHPGTAPRPSSDFTTTNWSAVIASGEADVDEATAALERLCGRYWYPIYAFIRRRGTGPHEAEDLTQAFFAHLLEKETLKKADRRKGKFRSFLLSSLTNFLTNEWDKRQTLKRGGRCQIICLDEASADELYRHEPVETLTPEKLFDRRWALLVVEGVFTRLRQEYAAAGKERLFSLMEPGLTGDLGAGTCSKWAAVLNTTEGAARVALHRLRRRFGELLRSEVAHTVASPEEVDQEIRHLLAVIST
jgi:DNA-directed RNA polymerase specialized sigma24 family protein